MLIFPAMRRNFLPLALLSLIAAAPATTRFSVDCSQNTQLIQKFEVFELTFKHPNDYADPFADASIDVIFTSPSGRTVTVGGFHYGSLGKPKITIDGDPGRGWHHPHVHYSLDEHDIWKARFAPDETGPWSFRWNFRDQSGETALGGGEFRCVIGRNPNHGFVRQDPKNFMQWLFDDGTPHYPIGLQDCFRDEYGIGTQCASCELEGPFRVPRPDGAPQLPKGAIFKPGHSMNPQNADVYFRRYTQCGFNLFRYSQYNCSPPLTEKLDRYLPYEAIMTDELLCMARKYHMRIMYGIFGFAEAFTKQPKDAEAMAKVKRFVKYSVDRWGSMIDFWEILNEQEADDDWYKIVAPYLHQIDPYHHPVATSWERPRLDGIDVSAPHWYGGRDDLKSDKSVIKLAGEWKKYNKPVIITEQEMSLSTIPRADPQTSADAGIRHPPSECGSASGRAFSSKSR